MTTGEPARRHPLYLRGGRRWPHLPLALQQATGGGLENLHRDDHPGTLRVVFLVTAAAHFTAMRGDLVRMVPPWIPNPELMVTFTGVCEVLGAIGLLVPATRRLAAAGLVVFLLAVLPANIYAAQAGVTLRGAPPTPLLPRIALQLLFIALVWWAGWRHGRPRA